MIILPADARDVENQKWIYWMDAQCFPDADGPLGGAGPVSFHGSHWFIAWSTTTKKDCEVPLAYAGWRQHISPWGLHLPQPVGFLYRAGVLPEARGQGLQKALIYEREADMKAHGIRESVTYTDPLSVASMKSLIAVGYEPYLPDQDTFLCRRYESIGHYVHWRKEL